MILDRRCLIATLAAALAPYAQAAAQPARETRMLPPSVDVVVSLAPSGRLRAGINAGNTVLVQRDAAGAVRGPSIDIANELGHRLGVPVEFIIYETAAAVLAGKDADHWDVAFMAAEPERAAVIAFTAPYVFIDGTYLVRDGSPFHTVADLDKAGVRIAVGRGAAYDLALTRQLKAAVLVRAESSAGAVEVFLRDNLDTAAGVRQMLVDAQKTTPGLRVLPDSFTRIEQAMATTKGRPAGARYLSAFIEDLKVSGFVRAALDRAGQSGAVVAPPA